MILLEVEKTKILLEVTIQEEVTTLGETIIPEEEITLEEIVLEEMTIHSLLPISII